MGIPVLSCRTLMQVQAIVVLVADSEGALLVHRHGEIAWYVRRKLACTDVLVVLRTTLREVTSEILVDHRRLTCRGPLDIPRDAT